MKNKIIMLIEDDVMLLNSNRLLLESSDYEVIAAETLAAAREMYFSRESGRCFAAHPRYPKR